MADFEKFDLTKNVPITYGNSTGVAAQAGDEPMREAFEEWMAEKWFRDFRRNANGDYIDERVMWAWEGFYVSPRATADVERNLRTELINEGALRQYCHNDGNAGFVTAYDFDITNRFLAAIATTKPGA